MRRNWKSKKRVPLTLLFLAAGALAYGRESSGAGAGGATDELEPYVVVATRTPLKPDRISPSVSYVSAGKIEIQQSYPLTDVLAGEPGLTVIQAGGKGAQTSLFSRGTESNHTAFFLDGRRLNPGFGNQYDLDLLTTANLESVQVMRGASSVNYGSSGIGGVVELRTRSGLAEEAITGQIEAEMGSNQYRRGALEAALSEGPFGFSISGSTLHTENERPNDDYDTQAVIPRLDYQINEALDFEVIGQYLRSEKELPGTVVSPTPDDWQETVNWLISPGLRYDTEELSVHLYYAHSRSRLDAFDFGSENTIEVDSDEVSLQVDAGITEKMLLTLGGVTRSDDASNSNIAFFGPPVPYHERFTQVGGYGQLIWQATEALELRGGIRYDHYTDFESQLTGNLEAIYHFRGTGLTFFAKASTSYAPPGASDIAFDSNVSETPLNPEESRSYEGGLRYEELFGSTLEFSILYFRNDIDELLDFIFDPVTSTFDTVNVKEASTEGVEVAFRYALEDKLNLNAAYTYLTAEDDTNEVRLARRPRHTIQLGAHYALHDSLRAGIQGLGYFDREDIDPATFAQRDHEDFFVVRLIADWAFHEDWTVFARIENLLDETYEPAAGFPALGRSGYLGLRYRF